MTSRTLSMLLASVICTSAVFAVPGQLAFAHTFSGDESASFLALVESIRVELDLVQNNLASNATLAEEHAIHGHDHLDNHTIEEIEERNSRLATDLPAALEDLHHSVANSTAQQVQAKIQNINDLLGETVTVRVESDQMSNSTVWGLVLANMADGVLEHYDAAYGIGTEGGEHGHGEGPGNMTHDDGNMTGMEMTETSSENTTGSGMEGMEMEGGNMTIEGGNKTLVDMSQYQSAQGLAVRMQELYNEQAKEFVPANSTEFTADLEAGLQHLIQAIENREQPNSITVIVHGEVHPSLQKAYNLQIIPEFPLPLLMIIPAIAGIIAATRLGTLLRR